ncbi:MAG: dihydrolipoamide acetyltransferase family protein, partial [Kiritimatiellia bacterium]|nr:dihydrolipoamide acetyltransferase family protein [Kiritimatiellia bacterium]
MATPVLMPRQGQSVESCILVEWLARKGDAVEAGQPLANIETDKATFELPAPAAGTLLDLFFEAGADVPVLTHVAAIGEPGEDVSSLRPSGGAVAPDAPASATGGSTAAPDSTPAVSPAVVSSAEFSGVSPRARHRAARLGMSPESLPGSGPGGRVLERDVLDAAQNRPSISPAARAAGARTLPEVGTGPAGRIGLADLQTVVAAPVLAGGTETPLRGIRKLIAERMRQSLANTAQLTMYRRFDASAMLACREWIKENGAARKLPNITLNDLIASALIRALTRHPALNAHFMGNRIAQFASVNLGVATDTPRGLMVPVVRDAQSLSLPELSKIIRSNSESCQKGSIAPDALTGGTFT